MTKFIIYYFLHLFFYGLIFSFFFNIDLFRFYVSVMLDSQSFGIYLGKLSNFIYLDSKIYLSRIKHFLKNMTQYSHILKMSMVITIFSFLCCLLFILLVLLLLFLLLLLLLFLFFLLLFPLHVPGYIVLSFSPPFTMFYLLSTLLFSLSWNEYFLFLIREIYYPYWVIPLLLKPRTQYFLSDILSKLYSPVFMIFINFFKFSLACTVDHLFY